MWHIVIICEYVSLVLFSFRITSFEYFAYMLNILYFCIILFQDIFVSCIYLVIVCNLSR